MKTYEAYIYEEMNDPCHLDQELPHLKKENDHKYSDPFLLSANKRRNSRRVGAGTGPDGAREEGEPCGAG